MRERDVKNTCRHSFIKLRYTAKCCNNLLITKDIVQSGDRTGFKDKTFSCKWTYESCLDVCNVECRMKKKTQNINTSLKNTIPTKSREIVLWTAKKLLLPEKRSVMYTPA